MTPFASGLVAGLLGPVLHFGLGAQKRRWQPLETIKRYRTGGRRPLPRGGTPRGEVRHTGADFWASENSPFQTNREIDLSLFRNVGMGDALQDRPISNGAMQSPEIVTKDETGSSEHVWENSSGLLGDEEFTYILVDEDGRPMRDPKPSTREPRQSHS
jgi:hypothetical protein